MPVSDIGANTLRTSTTVDVHVESRVGQFMFDAACVILPVIMSQLPPVRTPDVGWNIPNKLLPGLADPHFHESKQIDLLIGGGAFFDILQPERVQLDVRTLYLQDSEVGWLVTGEMSNICLLSIDESVEEDWKTSLCNVGTMYGKLSKANVSSGEEKQALDHFKATVSRQEDGRFVLQLPVKPCIADLGHSINVATSRFLAVERKLQQDATLREEYKKFMNEYLEMGHMREVHRESIIPKRSCYLPHHAVFKKSSLTTKIRIVFDASAKTLSGHSLNEVLMCGPKTQEDIVSILTRFQKHQYVITSDIEKMFQQVAVAQQDWDLQRILWWENASEILRTYQLVTVTTPASFLSTQCLVVLA